MLILEEIGAGGHRNNFDVLIWGLPYCCPSIANDMPFYYGLYSSTLLLAFKIHDIVNNYRPLW